MVTSADCGIDPASVRVTVTIVLLPTPTQLVPNIDDTLIKLTDPRGAIRHAQSKGILDVRVELLRADPRIVGITTRVAARPMPV